MCYVQKWNDHVQILRLLVVIDKLKQMQNFVFGVLLKDVDKVVTVLS